MKEDFYRSDTLRIKKILDEGIKQERFKNIDSTFVAQLIEMVMKGLELPFLLQKLHIDMNPRGDELFDILLDGLLK